MPMMKTEIDAENITQKMEVAAALEDMIPISSHIGVKITPPPNPTSPPMNPAYKLVRTVVSKAKLIFPLSNLYPQFSFFYSSKNMNLLYLLKFNTAIPIIAIFNK